MGITRDSGCLSSEVRVKEFDSLLQERMGKLLRISNLLPMELLPEVLDMWADPEYIYVFISYSCTDYFVSSPCSNILATGQLTQLKIYHVLVFSSGCCDNSHMSDTFWDRLHILSVLRGTFPN